MSKFSHGTARSTAGKKKAKKRPEPQQTGEAPVSVAAAAPVQAPPSPDRSADGAVLQFRPRAREGGRPAAGRAASAPRVVQQITDYSYVFTDLKIIGVLTTVLVVILVVLSFVIH